MDTVKFLKEFNRMCVNSRCGECRVHSDLDGCDIRYEDFGGNEEKLVNIVKEWSEKNPYLKPCPFCGATSSVVIAKNPLWHVVCYGHKGGCGGRTGYWDNKEKAVEAWNGRV